MDKLFGDIKGFWTAKKAIIDSLVFRLHYRYTFAILIAFCILVTSRQYIGDPIDCISKDDIPNELLDTYCWVHTTYSIESAWFKQVGVEIPYPGVDNSRDGKRVYHAYYQWVCFVLFLQAIFFYLPRHIWKNIEGHRMQHLVMDFHSPIVEDNPEKLSKDDKFELLVDYIINNFTNHQVYVWFYLFAGALNFINVIVQIYLTDVFLGGEFSTYGPEVVRFTEWDWTVRYDPMIRVFPRMTKCTFHRFGSSGDVQKHDAMCLIPINIVNEKIYVFLWFWFVLLAIITGVELLYRMTTMSVSPLRQSVLHHRGPGIEKGSLELVLKYCDKYTFVVLDLLGKNMDPWHYHAFMERLAHKIREMVALGLLPT